MNSIDKIAKWVEEQGIIVHKKPQKCGEDFCHFYACGEERLRYVEELIDAAIARLETQLQGNKNIYWRQEPIVIDNTNLFSASEPRIKICLRGCSW